MMMMMKMKMKNETPLEKGMFQASTFEFQARECDFLWLSRIIHQQNRVINLKAGWSSGKWIATYGPNVQSSTCEQYSVLATWSLIKITNPRSKPGRLEHFQLQEFAVPIAQLWALLLQLSIMSFNTWSYKAPENRPTVGSPPSPPPRKSDWETTHRYRAPHSSHLIKIKRLGEFKPIPKFVNWNHPPVNIGRERENIVYGFVWKWNTPNSNLHCWPENLPLQPLRRMAWALLRSDITTHNNRG